jgi:hypothetical protein
MQDLIWSVFMDGVWGPLAKVNNRANGGPDCAAESTPEYKFTINACLVS